MTFEIQKRLVSRTGHLGRAGVIHTPHGDILTPAFIPVGTKASVKAVLPESIAQTGARAVLANAYHLYLQPGSDVLDDGVWFRSHLNGVRHRFTPEISMRIQHELGADIIFAFDELTTLMNTRAYQEESLERTRRWAQRCLRAHKELTHSRADKPYQQLFGVIQGAQYEDLRRKAARDLGSMEIDGQQFDGFGIGGALEKYRLGTIVGWVCEELPENRARHLLGISEPDDLFRAVENGADTFDCVNPSRVARNGAIYSPDGRFNVTRAEFKRSFTPVVEGCECYTCTHYTKAYLHHGFKAKEMITYTLATIHNEYFTVQLTEGIRKAILEDRYEEFREETLGRFYAKKR